MALSGLYTRHNWLLQWESRLPLFIDEGSSGLLRFHLRSDHWVMESLGYYCCFLYIDIVCGRMNGWCKLWTGGVVGEQKKHSCTDWFSLIEVIEAGGIIDQFEHNQAIHRNVLSLSLSLSLSPDNSRTWLCTTLHILWWVVVTENNICTHVYFMNSRLRLLILVRVTSIINCMWICNPHNSLSKSSPKLS
jgi:hypothetical protein